MNLHFSKSGNLIRALNSDPLLILDDINPSIMLIFSTLCKFY